MCPLQWAFDLQWHALCRSGTKASTAYRVYSNAFMEGRQQNETKGAGYVRPGIPSITSPAQRGQASLPIHARSLDLAQHPVDAGPPALPKAQRAAQQPRQQQQQRAPLDAVQRMLQRVSPPFITCTVHLYMRAMLSACLVSLRRFHAADCIVGTTLMPAQLYASQQHKLRSRICLLRGLFFR